MQTANLKGFRLSVQQERLWSFWKENPVYRAQCAVLINGKLDRSLFLTTFQSIIDRYGILRTAFCYLPHTEVPLQVVATHAELSCPIVDLCNIYQAEQYTLLEEHFSTLLHVNIDLRHETLLRANLIYMSEECHMLCISLPSLCADSTTLTQLIQLLGRMYSARRKGEYTGEEPLQYVDVSAWQDTLLTSEDIDLQSQYWRQEDWSDLRAAPLPFTRTYSSERNDLPSEQSGLFTPEIFGIDVEESLITRLQLLAQRLHVSVSSLLLASWYILLWRLGDGGSGIVGVSCNGRIYEELADALGHYTRTVPMFVALKDNLSFEHIVHLTDNAWQEAVEQQIYFTWESMNSSQTDNQKTLPFFPICFEYDTWPDSFLSEELTFSLWQRYCCIDPFALKLLAICVGDHLQLFFHYDSQKFSKERIEHLSDLIEEILKSTVNNPYAEIRSLQILPDFMHRELLQLSCAPRVSQSPEGIHQLFEAQVVDKQDCLAVINGDEQLTYVALNTLANQLAQILLRQGAGPGVIIGLYSYRSIHMIIGMLAILKSGGAYVPLDPDIPSTRLIYQLNNAHASMLLAQQKLLPGILTWEGKVLCLETGIQEMRQESGLNQPSLSRPDDLAYVIYTSGSTGAPKGVMVQHQNLTNYTLALCQLAGWEAGLQFATVSTLSADLGNTAIFCALASGGCLQVLDYSTITSGAAFAEWATHHPIDVLKIVPSHLSALLADHQAQPLLPHRTLILGGEVFPWNLVRQLHAWNCTIMNHYGPTETTIGVLVHILDQVDRARALGEGEPGIGPITVPLGLPIANIEAYILDNRLQIVPLEVVGELYLAGAGLSLGYIYQPEQTAERFVPHPFSSKPGARLYKTGDLVCYTSARQIEFVGRRDYQIKLRGYRIELGEIDAVLRTHENVWDAVTVLSENVTGTPHMVSYVVERQQTKLTSEVLYSFLSERLPGPMVPSMFVLMDTLPLTINGKIDRSRLPVPQQDRDEEDALVRLPPRGQIEEILVEIWKELLGVSSLGVHDNFFHLGGHSLLATQLIARVRSVTQKELSILRLFTSPTIAAMARDIEQAFRGEQKQKKPPLVSVPRTQEFPLSFAQQRLWFIDRLELGNTAYLIPTVEWIEGPLNIVALARSLQALTERHEILRTTFHLQKHQAIQKIHPPQKFLLPLIDLCALGEEKSGEEVQRLGSQERRVPFDLSQGPLLRCYLLRRDIHLHVFLSTMHHIISDGWSNSIRDREILALYQTFVTGEPSSLEPLPVQYADFALWQRQWLQGAILEDLLAYWTGQLSGCSPLRFPTDHPRPEKPGYQGDNYSFSFPLHLFQPIMALSREEGCTLFMTLLAAFQTLLYRYTGQTDIVVGTDIANRTQVETEMLIGFFVNLLVLRNDLSGAPTFREVLSRTREMVLHAYAYQDAPFDLLVERVLPDHASDRIPLVQVLFVLQNLPASSIHQVSSLTVQPFMDTGMTPSKFDFALFMRESPQGLQGNIRYSTDLFDGSSIATLIDRFEALLLDAIEHPDISIDVINFYTRAEKMKQAEKEKSSLRKLRTVPSKDAKLP